MADTMDGRLATVRRGNFVSVSYSIDRYAVIDESNFYAVRIIYF